MTQESIKSAVKERYGSVAEGSPATEDAAMRRIAEAFGYSPQQLASIPGDANMGLSCGNPTAMASLREGETVLDLGCGGGLDVLLAAPKVGLSGRVIGIDMTEPMITLARRNADQAGAENVEFHLAEIEALPLEDEAVDCVISNCVLNLVPDKPRAFAEIFRVVRPGGRLAISDIALKQPLPDELGKDLLAYIGCIAGAVMIDQYVAMLREAGFQDVQVTDSGADLNAYALAEDAPSCCTSGINENASLPIATTTCCGETAEDKTPAEAKTLHKRMGDLLRRYDINRYAASVRVFAVKPAA